MNKSLPSRPTEYAECNRHKTRRLVKYCELREVRNADGQVINHIYNCKEEAQCSGSHIKRDLPISSNSVLTLNISNSLNTMNEFEYHQNSRIHHNELPRHPSPGVISNSTPSNTDVRKSITPLRYYDLERFSPRMIDGNSGWGKKVCWACGLESHEKFNCPNLVCSRCRIQMDSGHVCCSVVSSPFAKFCDKSHPMVLPPERKEAYCSFCRKSGHLDCFKPYLSRNKTDKHAQTCVTCAEVGHHAFDCPRGERDQWVLNILDREFSGRGVPLRESKSVFRSHLSESLGNYHVENRNNASKSRKRYRNMDNDYGSKNARIWERPRNTSPFSKDNNTDYYF